MNLSSSFIVVNFFPRRAVHESVGELLRFAAHDPVVGEEHEAEMRLIVVADEIGELLGSLSTAWATNSFALAARWRSTSSSCSE